MADRKIIKRDGAEASFDSSKIFNAISKANQEVDPVHQLSNDKIYQITSKVKEKIFTSLYAMPVEDIQELVEKEIMKAGAYEVAQKYIRYRYQRNLDRKDSELDNKILSIVNLSNEEIKQENSNKNPTLISTQRDYIAGEVSKDISKRRLISPDIIEAHDKGIIHEHDMDYYVQPSTNCCLVNLKDMLENGTVISGVKIDKPNSFYTAANITTQIVSQVCSNQFGGQTWSLAHLAPFVDISRQKLRKKVKDEFDNLDLEYNDEIVNKIAESRLKDEIKSGIQTIQYQLVTLMTTNGQSPFVTVWIYLDEVPEGQVRDDLAMIAEEMINQRIQGIKNKYGVWVAPAFPKIVYVLDENNIYEDSKYYYLTKLAAECTTKRMVPDYVSAKVMKRLKNGDVYSPMGCRSFLTPSEDHVYYSRFNQGVCTINLPYIACLAEGNIDKFWKYMEKYVNLCHKALRERHEHLLGVISDIAPIMWQHGALARLEPGEKIDKLLYNNNSTISLGYAGLYETCQRLIGKSHTTKEGRELALKILHYLNDKCAEWRANENISYSLYGTPKLSWAA